MRLARVGCPKLSQFLSQVLFRKLSQLLSHKLESHFLLVELLHGLVLDIRQA